MELIGVSRLKAWPLATLFVLPFLPPLGYVPTAMLIACGIALVCAFRSWARSQTQGTSLQWGLLLLGVATFVATGQMVLVRDASALTFRTCTLLATCALGVVSSRATCAPQVRRELAIGMLLWWAIWVGGKAWGYSFEELTVRLNYEEGLGNISQIAMYAGFAGLVWAASAGAGRRKWEYPLVAVALVSLAWWLDSKLLWGVWLLVTLSLLLAEASLRTRRMLSGGLGVTTLVAILILQPASLQGRIDLFQIVVGAQTPFALLGKGLGGMEPFLNRFFFEGIAHNTVGEIGPYAFNEYLQAWNELGMLGLLALVVVSLSVWRGPQPFLGLGWIAITAIMIPLQYVESSVLWVLTATLLASSRGVFTRRMAASKGGLFLAGVALGVGLLLGVRFQGLYRADAQFETGNTEASLQAYAALAPSWKWNAQFHLKYANKLTAAGRLVAANHELRLAVALNPSYTAVTHLADANFAGRQYEEALLRYQQAELLRPRRLFPRYRQVFCYSAMGRKQHALNLARTLSSAYRDSKQHLQVAMVQDLEKMIALDQENVPDTQ